MSGLVLRRNNYKMYKEYGKSLKLAAVKTIGVAGLCSGAGTTQLCIMLAAFLGGVLKKKTAVIGDEVTYSLMLRQMPLARAIQHKGIGSRHAYSVYGIDYYCGAPDENIAILRQKYDIIIQDISLNSSEDTLARLASRLSGCDVKILAGSMLPWKSKECVKKIERIDRFLNVKGLKMVTLTTGDKDAVKSINRYGVKVVPMPFERNPFISGSENLRNFMEILEIM